MNYYQQYPYYYYPSYPKVNNVDELTDNLLTVFAISISIVLLVIIIYIYWAYNYYRYSSERIGGYLLKKFTSANTNNKTYTSDPNLFLDYDTGNINSDLTLASTNILLKDKVTEAVKLTTPFSLPVTSNCSPLVNTCINL
jgi:hypothetical protein